jgi:hypothetical protein
MSAIRTGKTPVLTRSSPNPVTPPTPPRVAKFPKMPVIRFVSGSASPLVAPSPSPVTAPRNMPGCGAGRYRTPTEGMAVTLAVAAAGSACVVYGRREGRVSARTPTGREPAPVWLVALGPEESPRVCAHRVPTGHGTPLEPVRTTFTHPPFCRAFRGCRGVTIPRPGAGS